ncbi:hypothetical protein AHAS_Ahas01G0130700 [Arachis hypogaea]
MQSNGRSLKEYPDIPFSNHSSLLDIVHNPYVDGHVFNLESLHTQSTQLRLQLNTDQSHAFNPIMGIVNDWLLSIGDGTLGDNLHGESIVCIPEHLILPSDSFQFKDLVDFVYPDLLADIFKHGYLNSHTILSSTIDVVDEVNSYILSMLLGDQCTFLSSDTFCNKRG